MRIALHLVLHVLAPGAVARLLTREHWLRAWLIMLATMAVDLDHLLASPVFMAQRCSIGFHPLHSSLALAAYVLAALIPRLRLVGCGLLLHMLLDGLDCLLMRV